MKDSIGALHMKIQCFVTKIEEKRLDVHYQSSRDLRNRTNLRKKWMES